MYCIDYPYIALTNTKKNGRLLQDYGFFPMINQPFKSGSFCGIFLSQFFLEQHVVFRLYRSGL